MSTVYSTSASTQLSSGLYSVLPDREVGILLALFQRLQRRFVLHIKHKSIESGCKLHATHLAQPPSNSPGLLRSQIQRKIFLSFVVFPEILASFLVCHSHDSGN